MQIMMVSDSHAMDKATLLSLLKSQDADYYIHCGDIYMTYDTLPLSNFYIVRGNNDFGDIPFEITITLDSITFFVTHGHRYYVDYDIDQLLQRAKEAGASVVCYGHTHRPLVERRDSILCINPGSVFLPRGNYREPTYCILDTETMEVTYYNVKTNMPCNPFNKGEHKSFSLRSLFKK